jgi:hypothetical protein
MKQVRLICALSALGIALLMGTPTLAQDATPAAGATSLKANSFAAPYAPSPDLCTIAPMSTDDVANLLATPTPLFSPPVTENGIVALPGGTVADEAATAGVLETLTQLWACNNAQNTGSIAALFSPAGLQQTLGVTEDSTMSLEAIRAKVAAKLTPEEPRAEADWASIDAVVSVLAQPDGSIGVLVLNSDPLVSEGDQVLDYFAFTTEDGSTYQLSTIILDPFDLTPDYGFEKA